LSFLVRTGRMETGALLMGQGLARQAVQRQ
jgi:hypothetical protein